MTFRCLGLAALLTFTSTAPIKCDQTEKANHSSALPTCSKPAPDLCADGCGPGFCCLEWKWVSVHEPVSLALQKQNVFLGMTFHTCADEKQMALIKKLKVAGQPYAQADLIQSTDFYMDWNAKEYRTEECGLAEIPMSECATYTKSDMVEKVWGGVDAAKQQIYQVKCSCDVGEVKERVSESMATAERVVSIAKDAASSVDNAILMFT
eukprot:TRINITY_DN515_c0_g1_i2.p1 TRINITY_DN515_c0_g1~~TRINITY_DN515_c0_g1_i2.p1  ORF type:complete len:208 (-),score=32.31 TRINITY_DN515_c0_g1_i2:76-699(-)